MGDESLARHLIGNAEARRDALIAEAREEAARRIAQARAEADAMAAEGAAALAVETGRERTLRLGAARGEARRIVALARASLVEAILARVAERAARIPGSPRYPLIAEKLARELLPELPRDRCTVRADPPTAEAFGRLAPDAGGRLEPLPPEALGGIEVSGEDGTFLLRNTLASRLRKARPTLVESIGLSLGAPDG